MRVGLTWVLMFFSGYANAFCLNPFGCKPSNFDDCRIEASKRPSDAGVKAALTQCREEFIEKPAELKRVAKAEKLAATWRKFSSSDDIQKNTFKLLVGQLGNPSKSGADHKCLDDEGKSLGPECQWHEWETEDKITCNVRSTFGFDFDTNMVYRAEFIVISGGLFRAYSKPINPCEIPLR